MAASGSIWSGIICIGMSAFRRVARRDRVGQERRVGNAGICVVGAGSRRALGPGWELGGRGASRSSGGQGPGGSRAGAGSARRARATRGREARGPRGGSGGGRPAAGSAGGDGRRGRRGGRGVDRRQGGAGGRLRGSRSTARRRRSPGPGPRPAASSARPGIAGRAAATRAARSSGSASVRLPRAGVGVRGPDGAGAGRAPPAGRRVSAGADCGRWRSRPKTVRAPAAERLRRSGASPVVPSGRRSSPPWFAFPRLHQLSRNLASSSLASDQPVSVRWREPGYILRRSGHAHLLRRQQRPDAAVVVHHGPPGVCRPPAGSRRGVRLRRPPVTRRSTRLGRPGAGARRAACATPPPTSRGCDRPRAARAGTARRLRRGLPAQQPQRRRPGGRRLQPGHRVRAAAQAERGDGVQRPRRAGAGGVEDVPGRLPGGDPAAHADHPLGRAGAGVPARAGRTGGDQAAARLRRQERVLRGARRAGEPRTRSSPP